MYFSSYIYNSINQLTEVDGGGTLTPKLKYGCQIAKLFSLAVFVQFSLKHTNKQTISFRKTKQYKAAC